jgi:HEAT repeat protein
MADLETLIETLRGGDFRAGEAAAMEIANMGKQVVPALIQAFAEADIESDCEIGRALKKLGAVVVPDLVTALESEKRTTRLAAARTLWEFETEATATIPSFLKGLAGTDAKMRQLCAHGLGRIGAAARQVVPSLLRAAADVDPTVRSSALYALSRMGLAEDQASAVLKRALGDPDPEVRGWAVSCAKDFPVQPADLLPQLVPLIREIEDWRYGTIFEMLARVGPKATVAVLHLLALMQDETKPDWARIDAARTLWRIEPRSGPIVETLVTLLPGNAEAVSDAIRKIGPAAAAAVPGLVEVLHGEDWDSRWAAADALGAIGAEAQSAIPALVAALGHESGRVASSAGRALKRIGCASIPHLVAALDEPNPRIREFAADALALYGQEARTAIPALERGLQDRDRDVRFWCAVGLGSIAKSPEVIPLLLEAMVRSTDAELFKRSWRTLDAIIGWRGNRGWKFSVLRFVRGLPLKRSSKQKLMFWICAHLVPD